MKMKIEKYQNDNPKDGSLKLKKKIKGQISVGCNQKSKIKSSYRGSRI